MDVPKAAPTSETVKISLPWTWQPVKRRMLPGCDLFREGDAAMQVARKLIPLEDQRDQTQQSDDRTEKDTIPCSVFGCNQTFSSLLSYENHYRSCHCHSCVTCQRPLPSAFLLDVHIQENHDPLFALRATQQQLYRCLVESCGEKFPGPDDRRQHMIRVHHYPANFRFHRLQTRKLSTGPHQRNKLAQSEEAVSDMEVGRLPCPSRRSQHTPCDGDTSRSATVTSPSSPAESPSDKENAAAGVTARREGEEEGMEVLKAEKQVPRRVFVHKVPQTFSFGHGVSRGFQRPPGKKKTKKKGAHWHQRGGDSTGETNINIENVDMKDMADALGEVA